MDLLGLAQRHPGVVGPVDDEQRRPQLVDPGERRHLVQELAVGGQAAVLALPVGPPVGGGVLQERDQRRDANDVDARGPQAGLEGQIEPGAGCAGSAGPWCGSGPRATPRWPRTWPAGSRWRWRAGFTIDGLAAPFVEGIDGHPSNVIGLSMPLLRQMLADLGLAITDLWRTPRDAG